MSLPALLPTPTVAVARLRFRHEHDGADPGSRLLAEETPVALSYDGATQAVMMATPLDLADLGVGFSLSEGLAHGLADILGLEVVPVPGGIDLRIRLAPGAGDRLAARRRRIAGPASCGMCGLDSLAEANRPLPALPEGRAFAAVDIRAALASLQAAQALNAQTRAVHAACFWSPGLPTVVREDVGRHNALDKLAGAVASAGIAAQTGVVLVSSRLSVELVQKAAIMAAPILVGVSAPTALAVRSAEAAGMTLVGVARDDGFEVFTHPQRILEH